MGDNFLLGLDIGTSSVGWCLTDSNYNIIKKNGKSLWGVRLFEEANTAADRRMHRANRRRLMRRKERIRLLKDLFSQEMAKVDETFFLRLSEASLHNEDRENKFSYLLFNDINYSDKDFYQDFPTIYHLINDIINNDKKFDLRKVYLACAFLIKYRGHFLYEGEFKPSNFNDLKNFIANINILYDENYQKLLVDDDVLQNVIKDAKSARGKNAMKEVLNHLIEGKPSNLNKLLFALIAGSEVKLSKIIKEIDVDIDLDEDITFDASSEKFDENIISAKGKYPMIEDILDVFVIGKNIYDFFVLNKLLNDEKYLCSVMVNRYKEHHRQLRDLKDYIKENIHDKYKEVFRKNPLKGANKKDEALDNYAHYVGFTDVKNHKEAYGHCSTENFYKYLKKILGIDKIKKVDDIDNEFLKDVYLQMENGTYLLRQNSSNNGVFPMQINLMMLQEILNKQSKYYPFLLDKDEYGTVADKIVSLMKFRVPYYVGPLNKNPNENLNKFTWVKRTEEKIYPWNFDRVVDRDASAEIFITRMQNKCTYLGDQYCLPKESMIFSEYKVWSEINKLYINGSSITIAAKNYLFENVYEKHANVTKTMIKDALKTFYNSKDILITTSNNKEMEDIHSSLKSRYDFIGIFGKEYVQKNEDLIENIIKELTLFEDREIVKKRLKNVYHIDDDKIKRICALKYKGWGSLSKKFLTDLPPVTSNGEILETNILKIMRETNLNLQEILFSDEYNYQKIIEDYNNERLPNKDSYDIESMKKYIDDLYTSPMMKRALIQTCKIILELEKIIHHPINEFYIECTRENSKDKKRKESRYTDLMNYLNDALTKAPEYLKGQIEDTRNTLKERYEKEPSALRSDYLYLYFMQLGKCLYTGETIDIDDLFNGNLGKYDIDHIYPQSLVKDDSLDNRVLVLSSANRTKKDKYPFDYQECQPQPGFNHYAYFKFLRDQKFMSEEKFHRLTRKEPLTENELEQFINRQLVSTSQSVKAVADLLKHYKKDAKIIYSKANAVSDFRHKFDLIKSRDANNFHHAHDAYLNIVVGRTLAYYFSIGNFKGRIKYLHDNGLTTNPNKVFEDSERHDKKPLINSNGDVIWDYQKSIDRIKHRLYETFDILVTTMVREGNELFAKESIKPARMVNEGALPIKKGMDINKYGGYSDLSYGLYLLVESDDKKGKKYSLEAIPTIYKNYDESQRIAYLRDIVNLKNPKIIIDDLKINSVIRYKNSKLCITGKSGNTFACKNIIEPIFSYKEIKIIKLTYKALDLLSKKGYVKKNEICIDDVTLKEKLQSEIVIAPARNEQNEARILKILDAKYLYSAIRNKLHSKIYNGISAAINIREFISQIAVSNTIDEFNLIQFSILNAQLMTLLTCDRTIPDLTIIGGSASGGEIRINKTLKPGMTIIAESVTGFYHKVLWSYK